MNHKEQLQTFFALEKNVSYESHLQDTKQKVLETKQSFAPRHTLSFGGLILKQFRFLAWKIWLIQGMLLAAPCTVLLDFYSASIRLTPGNALPKFLCLCSGIIAMSAIPILKRSYRCRMSELEQSTRFSVGGNVLSQLFFIGIGDLFMLSVLGVYVMRCGLTGSVIFISLVIPFLTSTAASLMLWTRVSNAVFEKTAVLPCILPPLSMYALIEGYASRYGNLPFDQKTGGFIVYALICITILYRECRRLHMYGNTHKLA